MDDSQQAEDPELPDDDEQMDLFRQAVADARPLHSDLADTRKRPPAPRPLQLEADEQQVIDELLNSPTDWAGIEVGDEISYCRPGVQRRVMQRLRRGQFKPKAHLDLHGSTLRNASSELKSFLNSCKQRDISCVRIVHGKGRGSRHGVPVLKAAVDRWLRQRDDILAFSSAPSFDGGTGAVYVLLRKQP
ncbi:Smr/MutS family protein [Halorhodospira halochloris]|nr:Smr/MutS family protein [Halorhodospira halochloris]MBK1651207.1 DNA mismatch repair protein MutS [Halorhodospira halochloris]